jgi:hypothetical protein
MTRSLTSISARCGRIAAIVTCAISVFTNPAAASSERCWADWSTAAPIVRREALVSTKDLHDLARAKNLGNVVRITLCETDGRFVYRLVVIEPARSAVSNVVVDARQPF